VSPRATSKPRGGIDLGGTKIQTVVVDARNKVLGEARHPTPTEGSPLDVVNAMAAAMTEAAKAAGLATADLGGVGVGSPGSIDADKGTVAEARNLPNWEKAYPMAERLTKRLGTRVALGNDVQVATNGEFELGSGKPYKTVLGVFWGTGVGGGLVLNGKPWLGRGGAGEIGHMVVKRNGAKCTCGRRGCMEAYAGRAAMEIEARKQHEKGHKTDLFKIMHKHDRDRLTSGIWERAWREEDKLATHLLGRAVEALGTGIASAVNLLDPDAVIIGGGLGVRFAEPFAEPLRKEMGKHLFADDRPPPLHPAALGDLGGAIGAALLARQRD
jgi:glucokinase